MKFEEIQAGIILGSVSTLTSINNILIEVENGLSSLNLMRNTDSKLEGNLSDHLKQILKTSNQHF